MSLTPKQEKFCQSIVSGKSQADAYREAFNAQNMKAETIHKRASELMARGDIKGRVDEIRGPVVEQVQISLKTHLDDLLRLRNMAAKELQLSVALSAEISRGKASGLYTERVDATITTRTLEPLQDESFLG